jgi:ribosomal protein S18 acetylase RimI-like enzyme
MPLVIRKLEEKDKDQMRKLMKEFWMDYTRSEMLSPQLREYAELRDYEATIETELDWYLKEFSYVAEENGKLVGYIIGTIKEKKHRKLARSGYIEEFFVTEAKRKQGIGKQLFDTLVKDYKERSCDILEISAFAENKEAIDLYKRYGFLEREVSFVRKI